MMNPKDLKKMSVQELEENLKALQLQLQIVRTQRDLNEYPLVNEIEIRVECPFCRREFNKHVKGSYFDSGRF